ncbi:MAG: peptide chain release factor N(5)-glutamine methyltransferase [Actinomycetota bacterium]|nr:peptide chain release factor N(5)-glutamine methyltransferase [Actinomycetota bacterium]
MGPSGPPSGNPAPATWRTELEYARRRLGSDLEARRILGRASGFDRADLVRHFDDPVPARAAAFLWSMVERRRKGEPLQYVLGVWGFRQLDLMIDRRVLIPRPETEVVVEVALEELRRLELDGRPASRSGGRSGPVLVDLGTGSGAIALSLAVEVDGAVVWATDASADALAVARANLAGLGSRVAPRVRLAQGRWFDALPVSLLGRVDLVVCNPPYVAEDEPLPAEVADWEPSRALVSGPTGLEAIEEVVAAAPRWLARPGALVVEVAPHQAGAAAAMARDAGFSPVEVRPDLAGRARALVGRRA